MRSRGEERMMNKVCKQVSIESPGHDSKECVFSFDVPVPDVPVRGARIRVECAGACYRLRRTQSQASIGSGTGDLESIRNRGSNTSFTGDVSTSLIHTASDPSIEGASLQSLHQSPSHHGVRDAALYPGYEVAGIVDCLGDEVEPNGEIAVNDKVVVYPYEDAPHGRYAEYMTVPEIGHLVKIPEKMDLSVAAMLPTGALWALNTVCAAKTHITNILADKEHYGKVKVLVVGTGGLALWTIILVKHYFREFKDKVLLAVASLRDESMLVVKEAANVKVVQWNEDCYERVLIDRTKDACDGEVDIVIDFGTTSRSLHRSLQCVAQKGIVLISTEVAEKLLPKFSGRAEERDITIKPVDVGSIDQLKELVQLVASGEIQPPPHTVFPADQAKEVVKMLLNSEIHGRAILRFH